MVRAQSTLLVSTEGQRGYGSIRSLVNNVAAGPRGCMSGNAGKDSVAGFT